MGVYGLGAISFSTLAAMTCFPSADVGHHLNLVPGGVVYGGEDNARAGLCCQVLNRALSCMPSQHEQPSQREWIERLLAAPFSQPFSWPRGSGSGKREERHFRVERGPGQNELWVHPQPKVDMWELNKHKSLTIP
jgi:hypothetical protein